MMAAGPRANLAHSGICDKTALIADGDRFQAYRQ
jgi:hypothetical protein